jgi:hypothetical protein
MRSGTGQKLLEAALFTPELTGRTSLTAENRVVVPQVIDFDRVDTRVCRKPNRDTRSAA